MVHKTEARNQIEKEASSKNVLHLEVSGHEVIHPNPIMLKENLIPHYSPYTQSTRLKCLHFPYMVRKELFRFICPSSLLSIQQATRKGPRHRKISDSVHTMPTIMDDKVMEKAS